MPNVKKFTANHGQTGQTVYCIIEREADNFLLNDADGTFGAAPADPYSPMAEHSVIKGRYILSESGTVWNDGWYNIAVYLQVGGSPAPAADTMINGDRFYISADAIVYLEELLLHIQGLTLRNHVEDDITRNADGLKTASSIYTYNSAANATTHDKSTGLIAKENISITYDLNSRVSLFKVVKV